MTFKVKSGLAVNNFVVIDASGNITTTANNALNFGGQLPAYYTNATNISTGTVPNARLNAANTTGAGIVQLVDDIANTSITIAPTANAVKRAYDLAVTANSGLATAYSNAASYADTKAAAAYTNAASYADTKAAAAFANAVSFADTKASAAYSNATSYADTKAGDAFTNATSFASNASNLSTGTINNNRLNAASSVQAGIMRVIDDVTNTSITIAASANSVKRAYDSAAAAYTNAVSYAIAKSGTDVVTAGLTFSNTVIFNGAITANGTNGTNGSFLTSNGTATYWYQQPAMSLDNVLGVGNTTTKTMSVGNTTITGTLTVNGGDALNIRDIDAPQFNGAQTVFRFTVNNGETITPALVATEQMMVFIDNKLQKVHKRKVYFTGLVFSLGIPVVLETGDLKVNANGTVQFSHAPATTADFVGRLMNGTQTTTAATLPAPTTYPFNPLAIALDTF